MSTKIPLSEYEKTDSNYSAMRKGFFWMLKVITIIALTSSVVYYIGSFVSKPLSMDGIVALIGCLGVVAFGGKAAQSFGERPVLNKTDPSMIKKVADITDKVEEALKPADPNEPVSK